MVLESKSMTYGQIPFKKSEHSDESWINRFPWSWFGLIVCLYGFWTGLAYAYSVSLVTKPLSQKTNQFTVYIPRKQFFQNCISHV